MKGLLLSADIASLDFLAADLLPRRYSSEIEYYSGYKFPLTFSLNLTFILLSYDIKYLSMPYFRFSVLSSNLAFPKAYS